jgi:hypothetical protein
MNMQKNERIYPRLILHRGMNAARNNSETEWESTENFNFKQTLERIMNEDTISVPTPV